MIKARNYLFLAAAATLLLAGCQNGLEEESKGSSNVVTIRCNAGSPSSSRIASYSTDDEQVRLFEAGDQVCVSTDGQEAVIFQCTDADYQTWDEADESKFLLWTQNEMTFKAYYPVTTGTSMTSFTLPADQSTTGKIALADYMTYEMTCSNEYGNDIYLTLERKMARVIVRISGFGSQYDDDEKTVSNVSIYSEASGIADGNPTGSSTEIQPYAQGNGGQGSTYTALVVPGYGDSGARFIKLTDGEYNTLLVKGIPELEAGNSYTFNLVVGKNRIEVASVTVQDWTGETLTGGQVQEQAATITVTWNHDDITSSGHGNSFTKDGVTITAGMIDFRDKNFMDGGSFSTTLGNFTKIEVTTGSCGASGTGWSGGTWTGNASSVSFSGDFMGMGMGNTKLVFTIAVESNTVPEGANTVPEGAINGVFSVSSTKKVYFSKGNLRYASSTWSFFDNQYDYYTSYSADACDKFCWSTSATTYGMNTSTSTSTYSGDFVDWGATMGTGWFTLSKDEWTYLFDGRTVNGGTGSGKSYTLGQSVNGKLGVVIYPDNYTGAVYSGSDWATFESAGCVFLPATGYRSGSAVNNAGAYGGYWSATPYDTSIAYYVFFLSDGLNPENYDNRSYGYSVRLACEVE